MSNDYDLIKSAHQRQSVAFQMEALIRDLEAFSHKTVDVHCPFCDTEEREPAFSVYGHGYHTCALCGSLYQSPRLAPDWLDRFYAMKDERIESEGVQAANWESRVELIMRPRWKRISNILRDLGCTFPIGRALEVGPGVGYFTDVLMEGECAQEYVLVEPAADCMEYLRKLDGNTVLINSMLEDVEARYNDSVDLLFINSVIEHPTELMLFFSTVARLLKPGGWASLVDMHWGGLDLQVLRGDSDNIVPHIIQQVGTVEGVRHICARVGLELVCTASFGQMDMDILHGYAASRPKDHPLHGFALVLQDADVRKEMQAVLSRHMLTGYNGYFIQRPVSKRRC